MIIIITIIIIIGLKEEEEEGPELKYYQRANIREADMKE